MRGIMKLSKRGSKGRWIVVVGWLDPSVGMVTAIMLMVARAECDARECRRTSEYMRCVWMRP